MPMGVWVPYLLLSPALSIAASAAPKSALKPEPAVRVRARFGFGSGIGIGALLGSALKPEPEGEERGQATGERSVAAAEAERGQGRRAVDLVGVGHRVWLGLG